MGATVLRWKKLQIDGPLPPKVECAGCIGIDEETGDLVLFGGYSFGAAAKPAGFKDELWTLTWDPDPAWAKLNPAGLKPVARVGHTLVDSSSNRLLIFGGGTWKLWPVQGMKDIWEYDLQDKKGFVPLRTAEPSPSRRADAQFVVLPKYGRALFHGGVGDSYQVLGDTWALDLTVEPPRWRRVSQQTNSIGSRAFAFHYYDSKRDALIVVAGMRCYAPGCKNPGPLDAWALRNLSEPGGEVWVQLALHSDLPGSVTGRRCGYDPKADQAVCHGLWNYYDWPASDKVAELTETWTLRMEGERFIRMTRLDVGGTEPPLTNVDVSYDPVRDRLFAFGGWAPGASTQNDVWVLEQVPAEGPMCVAPKQGEETIP